MTFDLRATLTGTPTPFDSRVTGVDQERLVRGEEALVEALKTLVAEARAAVNGNGSVVAADGGKTTTVKLTLSSKKDGEPYADDVITYHKVPEAHAKFIGDAFSAIDDAVAKG